MAVSLYINIIIMEKVLRKSSENFKVLESVNSFLSEKGVTMNHTVNAGIVYGVNGKYYKYSSDGQYPDELPPMIEGRFIECDSFGNTDYYN